MSPNKDRQVESEPLHPETINSTKHHQKYHLKLPQDTLTNTIVNKDAAYKHSSQSFGSDGLYRFHKNLYS